MPSAAFIRLSAGRRKYCDVAQVSKPAGHTHTSRNLRRSALSQCRNRLVTGFGLQLAWPILLAAFLAHHADASKIDFNRDMRPLLSDTCFRCHGPDANARKAALRLDLRPEALKPAKSGATPIVPGDPAKSEAVRRIFTTKSNELMPPPKFERPLSAQEKELFRRWVAEGAEYRDHWAFIPPVKSELPKVKNAAWPRNSIDRFILAQLEQKGLKPAAEADKRTLIRRVSLDLTGLPTTPAEVDMFVADASP